MATSDDDGIITWRLILDIVILSFPLVFLFAYWLAFVISRVF